MAAERSYDAIVIGAGQGAKSLSMVLARAGLRLLSSKRGMWEEAALITVERRRKPCKRACRLSCPAAAVACNYVDTPPV